MKSECTEKMYKMHPLHLTQVKYFKHEEINT